MTDKKINYRKRFESYFVENNRIEAEREIIILPSGKYKLIIDGYKVDPNDKDPRVTRGIVKKLKEESVIADIKRNINYFFYHWIIHPNHDEYLLCAENYQGYTLVNLSKKVTQSFLPEEAKEGMGFIWYTVYPSPDKLVLAVVGCVWGMNQEVRFYDFSNPDVLPLKELGKFDERKDTKVIGWENNDTFVIGIEHWRRKSDNKRFEELSLTEQDELDNDPDRLVSIEVENFIKWHRFNP